LINKRKNI